MLLVKIAQNYSHEKVYKEKVPPPHKHKENEKELPYSRTILFIRDFINFCRCYRNYKGLCPTSSGGHDKQVHHGIRDVIESVNFIYPVTSITQTVPFSVDQMFINDGTVELFTFEETHTNGCKNKLYQEHYNRYI